MQTPTAAPISTARALWHSSLRFSAGNLLLAALYFYSGKLGLSLATINPSVTAIWPAAGIAVSALALFGYRLWPGILVGSIVLNFFISGNLPGSLAIACANTTEAAVSAWFIARLGGVKVFERTLHLLGFLALSGFVSAAISATAGTLILSWELRSNAPPLPELWFTWWIGDAMSIWSVTPFLVLGFHALVKSRIHRPEIRSLRFLEGSFVFLALIIGNAVSYGGILPEPFKFLPAGFSSLPSLFWVAMRFGALPTSASLLLHCVFAITGTIRGHGQYAELENSYLVLQLNLATRIFLFQSLAVLVASGNRLVSRLRASEQRIDGIIQSVPGVVWESMGDPATNGHRYTFVSHQLESEAGYSPAEIMDHPAFFKQIVHPEDRERVIREASDTFAGKGHGIIQYRVITRDGRVLEVEARSAVIRDVKGVTIGRRGFILDISERKRFEALLKETEEHLRMAQKMETVGRLAGGIAHDFNNHLTAINGFSDLILGAVPQESPIAGYAREIRKAGTKAADLTAQLLTFSRKDVYKRQMFDLNGLIADQERFLTSIIGDEVRLGLSLAPGPLRVKADPDQVERILANLVRNARDAVSHGGVITVSTAYWGQLTAGGAGFFLEPKPGPYVVLSVADTGAGISAETMGHLFEPFFTTKGISRARGLGLSTIYGILERSGWRADRTRAPASTSSCTPMSSNRKNRSMARPDPVSSRSDGGCTSVQDAPRATPSRTSPD
jgi:PAS domain S-box-containing protein